jgi:septum formation inhibitor-activating ATPase MinD
MSLIVNRARGDLIMENKMMLPIDIQDMLKTDLIAIIPEEDEVFLSSGYELPKKSQTFKAFKLLSLNVVNGTKKLYDVTNKYTGFFGSIRRSLKKSV